MIKNVARSECENNPNFIVPIAFDDVFHEVFGTQKNIKNTTLLVSALLNIPYKEIDGKVKIKNVGMSNPKIKSKRGEKDIVVFISKKEPLKINIEMNKYSISKVIIDRNVYFQSDLFVSGLETSNPYSDLRKTIQFNLNPEFIDKINEPVVDEYYYRNEYGNILTEKSLIVHINVAKMSYIWYNEKRDEILNKNPLLYLLGTLIIENEKDKFKKLIQNKLMDKEIGKMIERIVMNMNSDINLVSRYYDIEESRKQEWEAEKQEFAENAAKEAFNRGINQGFSQGIIQTKRDMVVSLYQNDVSVDIIKKSTGLSIDDIEKLIEESKSKKK